MTDPIDVWENPATYAHELLKHYQGRASAPAIYAGSPGVHGFHTRNIREKKGAT